MAKIRGIKPDFWTDETVVEVSFAARLLFIGMWNFACDNGHVEDKPKQIKMRVFPADNVEIEELLEELLSVGLIERGDGYITIPKLSEHQRIDRRYFVVCDAPLCVKPVSGEPSPVEATSSTRREDPLRATSTHVDGEGEVKGSDGDGEGEVNPSTRKRPKTPIPANWSPRPRHVDYCKEHGLDLNKEAFKFVANAEAKDERYVLWDRAFDKWLGNAIDWGRGRTNSKTQSTPPQLPLASDLDD